MRGRCPSYRDVSGNPQPFLRREGIFLSIPQIVLVSSDGQVVLVYVQITTPSVPLIT